MTTQSQRYEILDELGRGGMGVVYKAKDTALGRIVAVKRLLVRENKIFIDRFFSEAKSIAALNHPNIIQIFDMGEDQEGLFIITEFVDGSDMARLLKSRGSLLAPEALSIIIPVCKAMQYAHKRSVIHRDIKPGNVLLTRDGIPKIADFGLARTAATIDLELTGMIMGTQQYAAPEQLTDAKHVDGRADIYSIGALFYEMLTGHRPNFFREHLIPEAFKLLISKAMDNDPAGRFKDLEGMLSAIEGCIRSAPEIQKAVAVETGAVPDYSAATIVVGATTTVPEKHPDMILVPKGPFPYGPDRIPMMTSSFYIDKFPVTNEEFKLFKPSHTFSPTQERHPATRVTFREACAYAQSHGKRLPTEIEWEKAAVGYEGRAYPWGDEFDPAKCNCFESGIGRTTPVDAYPQGASSTGVMDMAGNAWEWTSTPLETKRGAYVLKGGAFDGESKYVRCVARISFREYSFLPTSGFRCALTDD